MQESNHPFLTPSSTSLTEDLLFFDTFSHSNSDKDNFDLVQFPSPVIIDQIKVVPLGQPIEANIPGSVRLGATNPSKCELEFFINDLTKQDAHTMTDLGKFYCSEKDTVFAPPLQIQTDGLLLRGSYRTLTLAIFGQVVPFDEKPEDEQVVMSAASPPAQTPASPIASERDVPYIVRSMNDELIQGLKDDEESIEDVSLRPGSFAQDDPPIDGVDEDAISDSRVNDPNKSLPNPEDFSNSGDGATPTNFNNSLDKRAEELDYSNDNNLENITKQSIQSDTRTRKPAIDHSDRTEKHQQNTDEAFAEYDAREWYFDIETYSPKPLSYFPDPSLTLQERTLLANKTASAHSGYGIRVDKEIEKVKEMFEVLGCSDDMKTEDWVTLVEDLTNDIANMSLSQTVSNEEMLRFLVEQVSFGLNMSLALGQKQTGFKVRHLKAGLKLATILFHCGQSAIKVLLEADIPMKVLELYNQDQMSSPLRLHIFKCLNAACDTTEGVEHIIKHQYHWADAQKVISDIKHKFFSRSQEEAQQNIKDLKLLGLESGTLTCYQYMILLLLTGPVTRITIAIGNLIKKIRLYKNLSELRRLSQAKNDFTETEDGVFEQDQDENLDEKTRLEECSKIVQDVVMLTKDGCANIAQPVRYLPAKVQFHTKPTSNESYLALYKWIKHFRIVECLDLLLVSTRADILEIEHSIKLRSVCLTLIQQILDSPKGTQMLLSSDCYSQTANLIKNLAKRIDLFKRKSHLGLDNLVDASLCREESLSTATCRDMSLKLAYSFKVLSCIDKLFDFHRDVLGNQTAERQRKVCDPEKVLHQLYIISEHPYGLTAIMKHFACIGNLDCILRFLDMQESQKHLEFVKETSMDYVLELVGTFFRLNNNVLEIAEEYLDTLTGLVCKIKDKTLSTRIKSLLPWLTPFDTNQPFPLITYSEETFRQLTRVIRKSIPDCSIPFAQGLEYELPPQLITAVRILRQLCISPQVESFIESNFDIFSSQRLFLASEAKASTSLPFVDSLPRQQNPNQSWNLNFHSGQTLITPHCSPDECLIDRLGQLNNLSKLYQPLDDSICGDLKYHYGIMQVFEQEGLKRLLNTLRELIGNYPRPIYQSAALCGLRGRIVISYIHSVVMLLHSITCHLIDARGKEFRDTSIIGVVLETYSLLCFAPKPENDKLTELSKRDELATLQKSITLKYDNYQLAQQAKKLILSILISYSQICLSVSDCEENVISKSMWTKMLKEVVDFTLSAPVFFQHGLDVLTRILPAPLPNASMLDTMDQEQLFKNINHRKLWSAHLHPLHQRLELMVSNMSLSCQSNIRTLLYYLCNQLCDLSSNAACMVAKAITDTLTLCTVKLTADTTNGDASEQGSSGAGNPVIRASEDRASCLVAIGGSKESKFAIRMILDVLANLITNQAFETAFTNHLQVIAKKDEKILPNLVNIIKSQEECKTIDMAAGESGDNFNTKTSSVSSLIEIIRAMADLTNSKDNFTPTNAVVAIAPPEEMTKIDLIEMTRKTSDRFNLTTGVTKTYRLKVLLDINSRAHRSNELASSSKRFERAKSGNHKELLVQPPNQKPFVASMSGRSRGSARPDSFRSRPQNTSRPPSIHVDDFNDIYGESPGQGNVTTARYGGAVNRKDEYRSSPGARFQDQPHGPMGSPMSGPSHGGRHGGYFNPTQPQPSPFSAGHPPHHPSPGGAYGGRSHNKSRRMK